MQVKTHAIQGLVTVMAILLGTVTGNVSGLSLQDVIARVDESMEVRGATGARDAALQQVNSSGFAGDPTLSLSPGVRADGYDDRTEPDRWAATINLNASIPIGLSAEQMARLQSAREDLVRAELQLEQVRNEQLLRTVTLFTRVWLREQEGVLLEAQRSVMEERLRLERLRFDRGEVSWDALVRVESEYRDAQIEAADARAEQWSAAIDLALATGIPPDRVSELSRPAIDEIMEELTVPMIAPVVRMQEQQLATAIREAAVPVTPISQVTFRAGLDLDDHTASLSYSVLNPTVSLSWSPGNLILLDRDDRGGTGDTGSGGDYDWTVSMGVTVGLTGIGSTRLERTAQAALVDRQAAILQYVLLQAEARIHNARTGLEQAERDLSSMVAAREQAELALEIMEARSRSGQVRTVELEQARVAVQRAEFAETRAELALDEARLALVIAGGIGREGSDTK